METSITLVLDFNKVKTLQEFEQKFFVLINQIANVYPRPITLVIYDGLTCEHPLVSAFTYAAINDLPLPIMYQVNMPGGNHSKQYNRLPENIIKIISIM